MFTLAVKRNQHSLVVALVHFQLVGFQVLMAVELHH